jgi:hypothetical protein
LLKEFKVDKNVNVESMEKEELKELLKRRKMILDELINKINKKK